MNYQCVCLLGDGPEWKSAVIKPLDRLDSACVVCGGRRHRLGPSLPALRGQHDLVDEVDDGRGWLLGVQLREQVTHVLSYTSWLLRHEAKHSGGWNRDEDVSSKSSTQSYQN